MMKWLYNNMHACIFIRNKTRRSMNDIFLISIVFHQFFTVFQIYLVYDIRMEKAHSYE